MRILIIFSLIAGCAFAQNVGVNTPNPDPSAILQVEGNYGGLLPPRLTTAERDAIASPAPGILIYNKDTNCMEYWNGTKWISTCAGTPPCSPPPASVGSSNTPVCENSTLTLTASPVSGATYVWNAPNGEVYTGSTVNIANASAAQDGKFTLSTWALGCYSDPDTVEVAITPANWRSVGTIPAGVTVENQGTWSILDGKIYYMGGADITNSVCQGNPNWEYDIANDTWTQRASVPGPTSRAAHSFALDGKVYYIGGYNCTNGAILSHYYVYDVATNSWSGAIAAPGGARHHGWAHAANGKGYLGFGAAGGGCTSHRNDFYEFDPATSSWTAMAAGPAATTNCIIGGFHVGNDYYHLTKTNLMHRWTAATNSWTSVASNPGGWSRVFFGLGDRGYTISGINQSVHEYDPDTNSWTRLNCDFPGAASGFHTGMMVENGKAYFLDTNTRTVWEFTAAHLN